MTTNLPAWQPPPDFVPVESTLPGISVFAPRPKDVQVDAPQTFACPQCGATTKFDVAAGSVACEHCGYTAAPKSQNVGLRAQVMEFTLETLSEADMGWGVARKEMHCEACGAELAIAENALTATCPFCASNRVNVRTAPSDQLRPRFLIPFKIQPEATRALAQKWLGQGWYHPNELGASAIVDRFTGIYLPFWTFSAQVASTWKAEVGYEHEERYYDDSAKEWRTRTEIRWQWEDGRAGINVDDLLISGSTRLSHVLLKRLYPFNLYDLVSYAPDFLAGWQAQTYDISLPRAWEQGKAEMRESAKKACYDNIRSSHVRNFNMTADFDDETWRYVLLPVYVAAYNFEDNVYHVMINGQTSAIAGQKPVAWWKIWLAVAAMLSPGLFLVLTGLPLLLAGGIGLVPLILGAILFIAGIAGAVMLYRNAVASEAA
jgi:Zn finger protein HypA/HybF involved in hydrogenase expression